MTAAKACLQKLPQLRFLKFIAHPESLLDYDSGEDELYEEILNHRFAKETRLAADKIFESLASSCPSLVALVIDASDADPLVTPVGFLRAKQLDLYGKPTYVGVPVQVQELVYHEPCSKILFEESARPL